MPSRTRRERRTGSGARPGGGDAARLSATALESDPFNPAGESVSAPGVVSLESEGVS